MYSANEVLEGHGKSLTDIVWVLGNKGLEGHDKSLIVIVCVFSE